MVGDVFTHPLPYSYIYVSHFFNAPFQTQLQYLFRPKSQNPLVHAVPHVIHDTANREVLVVTQSHMQGTDAFVGGIYSQSHQVFAFVFACCSNTGRTPLRKFLPCPKLILTVTNHYISDQLRLHNDHQASSLKRIHGNHAGSRISTDHG